MSVRAIEAEVSIKSGVQTECTIGRGVPQYINRPVYDGQTEVYPSDADIVLPTAGLTVESDILIHAIPRVENVYEGEFIETDEGVLTIDTGYVGNDYPKVISIYPVNGVMRMDDDFWRSASNNAINVITYIKYREDTPTYSVDEPSNFNRMNFAYGKKMNVSQNVSQYSGSYGISYVLTDEDNNGRYGAANCVRMPNNHTLKIFVSPTTGKERLSTGIRYKYQVFY